MAFGSSTEPRQCNLARCLSSSWTYLPEIRKHLRSAFLVCAETTRQEEGKGGKRQKRKETDHFISAGMRSRHFPPNACPRRARGLLSWRIHCALSRFCRKRSLRGRTLAGGLVFAAAGAVRVTRRRFHERRQTVETAAAVSRAMS